MRKNWISLSALLLALAVCFGALGAHGLKQILNPDQIESFETGVRYHFWHGLALLVIQLLPANLISERQRNLISYLFLGGIMLFSFSIYFLSMKNVLNLEKLTGLLGPLTPLGGILLISGWVYLGIVAWKSKTTE